MEKCDSLAESIKNTSDVDCFVCRPYLLENIALQADVSLALVDRVLHRRVNQAIAERDRHRTTLGIAGRKLLPDLVMEVPRRFTDAVRHSLEAELPRLVPAILRVRHHFAELRMTHEAVALLGAIRRQGTDGLSLKVADLPRISGAAAAPRRIERKVSAVGYRPSSVQIVTPANTPPKRA